jgi:hypothetical protein
VHQSSTEETRTAEHHNRGHHLLRHAGLSDASATPRSGFRRAINRARPAI